jgi:single-strand DNA-binding protein
MAGISKVILIGNLGRDPETRYTPSGAMNVQFSMAVSRRWTDQNGQQQERTHWYRVTAWRRLAEILDGLTQSGALTKGKQVYVEGRLDPREWQDQQGQTRTSLDVDASEVQLLGTRPDGEGGGFGGGPREPGGESRGSGGGSRGEQDTPDGWDDVPF